MSSAIRLISGAGVPVTTATPNQPRFSKPATPASDTVGTSGSEGDRVRPVTASGRSLRSRRKLIDAPRFGAAQSIWPPIRSVMATTSPLYGTCTESIFAKYSKLSAARWTWLPTPAEP